MFQIKDFLYFYFTFSGISQNLNENGNMEDSDFNVMSNLLSNLKRGNMASVRKSVKIQHCSKFDLGVEIESLNAARANLRPNLRVKSNTMGIQFKREI